MTLPFVTVQPLIIQNYGTQWTRICLITFLRPSPPASPLAMVARNKATFASCPYRTPVSVNRSLSHSSQASQSSGISTTTRPSADNFRPPTLLKPLMLKTDTPTLSHVSIATRPVIVTTPTAQLVPTDATSLATVDPTQGLPVQNNYSSAVCKDDVLELTNFGFSCSTPINIVRLEQELSSHPDQDFVQNLLRDLSSDFNIGYTGPWQTSTVKNLLSVRNNP